MTKMKITRDIQLRAVGGTRSEKPTSTGPLHERILARYRIHRKANWPALMSFRVLNEGVEQVQADRAPLHASVTRIMKTFRTFYGRLNSKVITESKTKRAVVHQAGLRPLESVVDDRLEVRSRTLRVKSHSAGKYRMRTDPLLPMLQQTKAPKTPVDVPVSVYGGAQAIRFRRAASKERERTHARHPAAGEKKRPLMFTNWSTVSESKVLQLTTKLIANGKVLRPIHAERKGVTSVLDGLASDTGVVSKVSERRGIPVGRVPQREQSNGMHMEKRLPYGPFGTRPGRRVRAVMKFVARGDKLPDAKTQAAFAERLIKAQAERTRNETTAAVPAGKTIRESEQQEIVKSVWEKFLRGSNSAELAGFTDRIFHEIEKKLYIQGDRRAWTL